MKSSGLNHNQSQAKEERFPVRRHMDFGLFIVVFLMICFGLVMLFSASMTEGFASENDPAHFVSKQLIFIAGGFFAAMIIANFIKIRFFDKIWMVILLYGATVFLLVAVFFPANPILRGVNLGGATRWVSLMGFRFQPTEVAKFSLVFCFAGYVSWVERKRDEGSFKRKTAFGQAFFNGFIDIALPGSAILIWLALIALEPHISCIVIMSIMIFFLFISAKIKPMSWLTGALIMILIIALVVAVFIAVRPLLPEKLQNYVDYEYVKTRLDIFSDIDSVDKDTSFQTRQSINAIGSGGIFGVGFGSSVQKWGYLPMQYNDYVFSIIAEELGLVGALSVLLLFSLYLILGVRIANRADSIYSMLIAFGYAVFIPVQAFLNIGVATNVVPPTGITLPFFSYGGTSSMIFVICVGFLLCVSRSGTTSRRRRI
ncbi:MAG: FtsW/RodA/SpoVE family cell cycle protein [Eubacteriales bacterium]|nr:FtsW/RodA/SpoVE family cell cycle protein [Eubacteriales bacterium]MDD4326610.1 FtsW/RodA/SpoVE family cell cycle protein [Eubacteriales bacterium]MDD4716540.1 FtsW/RodA/SpoVE family cell cycle protein [Eubacteriales bacterium]